MRFAAHLGAMMAAVYAASGQKNHMTQRQVNDLILGAQTRIIVGDGVTVKEMAKARTRDGRTIFVPSRKWVDRSCYPHHEGAQEMARRVRQARAAS